MTKRMREAIEALRELPEEKQDTIARAILDYASHDDEVYHLTEDERAEVARDDEVRAVYKRVGVVRTHGLHVRDM
jgi:hypothetical protein